MPPNQTSCRMKFEAIPRVSLFSNDLVISPSMQLGEASSHEVAQSRFVKVWPLLDDYLWRGDLERNEAQQSSITHVTAHVSPALATRDIHSQETWTAQRLKRRLTAEAERRQSQDRERYSLDPLPKASVAVVAPTIPLEGNLWPTVSILTTDAQCAAQTASSIPPPPILEDPASVPTFAVEPDSLDVVWVNPLFKCSSLPLVAPPSISGAALASSSPSSFAPPSPSSASSTAGALQSPSKQPATPTQRAATTFQPHRHTPGTPGSVKHLDSIEPVMSTLSSYIFPSLRRNQNSTKDDTPAHVDPHPVSAVWKCDYLIRSSGLRYLFKLRVGSALRFVLFILFLVMVGLRISHPAVVAFVSINLSLWYLVALSLLERRIMRLLISQFEFWFLCWHGLCLAVFGTLSMVPASDDDLQFIFCFLFFGALFCIFACVVDGFSTRFRTIDSLVTILYGVVALTQLLIVDLTDQPLFSHRHRVAVAFWGDSVLFAHSATFQLLLFFCKYVVSRIRDTIYNRRTFALATFPIRCKVSQLQLLDFSEAVALDVARALGHRIPNGALVPGRPLYLIHVSTHIPELLCYTEVERNAALHSYVHRSFLFCMLSCSPATARFVDSKWYSWAIAGGVVILIIQSSVPYSGSGWVSLVLLLAVMWCEATRFDRTLLKCVIRRFEFWVTLTFAISFCVFGSISKAATDGFSHSDFAALLTSVLYTALVISLDAGTIVPRAYKIIYLVAGGLAQVVVLLTNLISNPTFSGVNVCFVFCGDARVIALSALLTMTIISLRFLWRCIMQPDDCMLLRSSVSFNFFSRAAEKSSSSSSASSPLPLETFRIEPLEEGSS